MNQTITKNHFSTCIRVISSFLVVTFLTTTVLPPGYAQTIGLSLPVPGAMVGQSQAFVPALLKGMTVYPDNPLQFDFIIDSGHEKLKEPELKKESGRLVKYFLASMTVPQNDLWVNLSPNEKDRIIPDELGKTELGRDLLAQDYILKQLTATMMYPEEELGKKFWERVRKIAKEKYGITEIPTDTFNKVWILPETAMVYEYENTVYITDAHLKVMLDSDYEAMQQKGAQEPKSPGSQVKDFTWAHGNVGTWELDSGELSKQVIREVILPQIEKEVNEGKNFATLRQIYHSLILAKWYKQTVKNSIMSQVYIDQNKTAGIEINDPAMKETIYDRYMQAYKKGVFNYIKEDYDELSQTVIPRQYFSGGFKDSAMVVEKSDNTFKVAKSEVGAEYRSRVIVRPTAAAIVFDDDKFFPALSRRFVHLVLAPVSLAILGAVLFIAVPGENLSFAQPASSPTVEAVSEISKSLDTVRQAKIDVAQDDYGYEYLIINLSFAAPEIGVRRPGWNVIPLQDNKVFKTDQAVDQLLLHKNDPRAASGILEAAGFNTHAMMAAAKLDEKDRAGLIPILHQNLKNSSDIIVEGALKALSEFDSASLRSVVPELLNLLNRHNPGIRLEVMSLIFSKDLQTSDPDKFALELAKLMNTEQDHTVLAADWLGVENYSRAERQGKIPQVMEIVDSLERETRIIAAYIAGKLGTKANGSVDGLIRNLSSKDAGLQLISAQSLGKIGPLAEKALPKLEEIMNTAGYEAEPKRAAGTAYKRIKNIPLDPGEDKETSPRTLSFFKEDDQAMLAADTVDLKEVLAMLPRELRVGRNSRRSIDLRLISPDEWNDLYPQATNGILFQDFQSSRGGQPQGDGVMKISIRDDVTAKAFLQEFAGQGLHRRLGLEDEGLLKLIDEVRTEPDHIADTLFVLDEEIQGVRAELKGHDRKKRETYLQSLLQRREDLRLSLKRAVEKATTDPQIVVAVDGSGFDDDHDKNGGAERIYGIGGMMKIFSAAAASALASFFFSFETGVITGVVSPGAGIQSIAKGMGPAVVSVTYNDIINQTPEAVAVFHELAGKGEISGLGLMLQDGFDVNATNDDGETALITAINRRQVETVKFLLEQGGSPEPAAIKLAVANMFTALDGEQILFAKHFRDIVDALVSNGTDLDSASRLAKRSGQNKVARFIAGLKNRQSDQAMLSDISGGMDFEKARDLIKQNLEESIQQGKSFSAASLKMYIRENLNRSGVDQFLQDVISDTVEKYAGLFRGNLSDRRNSPMVLAFLKGMDSNIIGIEVMNDFQIVKYRVENGKGLHFEYQSFDDLLPKIAGNIINSVRSEGGKDDGDETAPGGIDMNEINLNREAKGKGGKAKEILFEMQGMEPLLNMDIQGFSPVIIDMVPINSVLPLLGLRELEKGIKYGKEEAQAEIFS
ncbi:MAG: ankyrin repeat domain-containing protein [Candidatus Omnitrophota bacterium]